MADTEDLKSSEETRESSNLSSGTKFKQLLKGPFKGKRIVIGTEENLQKYLSYYNNHDPSDCDCISCRPWTY